MIKAVVFDLDDTLCTEIEYVKSGFRAIAKEYKNPSLYDKLYELFCDDKKNVYQRAGLSEEECKKCVDIYRRHFPDISLKPEVKDLLVTLKRQGYKLGIISDGRPEGQRNKIAALGLDKLMDCIIITDELGGEVFRKPHPKAFEIMRKQLGVEFDEMMYVGDNPAKDFFIGSVYPITTVRITAMKGIYGNDNYKDNVIEQIRIDKLRDLQGVLK